MALTNVSGRSQFTAISQAVVSNAVALEQSGFHYVLIAFPFPGKTAAVLGLRLSDWKKWGTPSQPESPLVGLITNKNIEFKSV